jgi:hypothetical protein
MPSIVVEYSNGGPILTMAGDTGILLPQSVRNLERGASATGLLDPFRSVLKSNRRASRRTWSRSG